MTFAQRRNCLTTYFSERIPVVKRRMAVAAILRRLTSKNGDLIYTEVEASNLAASHSIVFNRQMWKYYSVHCSMNSGEVMLCLFFKVPRFFLLCPYGRCSFQLNTFAASYLNTQGLNNSCLKYRQLRP